ncbi:MAG TPA: S1 RNA-binding domain-containing protein [Candidatus Margulisiibacteriota bacterium]|nr:S1 RNA-binding domain-containing protein [Candidatus Margulisiibacteriota bacterium]
MIGKDDAPCPPVGTGESNHAANGDEDFAALLAASETAQSKHGKIALGDLVRGRVIAIGQTSAFVGIGAKGEATIDLAEFRNPESGELTLAVGDQIEATVVDDGSGGGAVVLKRSLGRGGHLPAELEQALAHRIPVEGLVTGENKGGFDVQIGSLRAFCPASQIDRRRGESAQYIGQRFRFRVTKIESGGRNVVVSRRELLEEEAAAQAAQTWERLHVGAVVQGTVTSVRDFGAFVDLGGVEGLIHVSELGHGRVGHPSDVLTVGQLVEVQVVKIDPADAAPGARRQVGLSMKALAPDPWTTAVDRFPIGTTVRGIVRRLEAFGAFVEIAPGVDGLVHVSKLVLDRRVSHPRQAVSVGQEVEVTVLAVDAAKRRISLSMVEQVRQEQEAAKARERAETAVVVAQSAERQSLGSFADLLAASRKPR